MADEKKLSVWLKSRTPFDEHTMERLADPKNFGMEIIDIMLPYPVTITSQKKFLAVLWILEHYPETNWLTAYHAVCACKRKEKYLPHVVQAVSARLGAPPNLKGAVWNTAYFLARMFEHGGMIDVEYAIDICVSHSALDVREMAREYLLQFNVHIPAEFPPLVKPDFPDV